MAIVGLQPTIIGLVTGGMAAMLLAFRMGATLTSRLKVETDPGRQLVLDLLLVLVVLLALVGVGLATAPLA